MYKLELDKDELLTLQALIESDMETSSGGGGDYEDVGLMQFYLDRAKVLVKVQELLGL